MRRRVDRTGLNCLPPLRVSYRSGAGRSWRTIERLTGQPRAHRWIDRQAAADGIFPLPKRS